MSLITKSNPVGIDIPIDTIQRALHTALVVNGSWMSYQSNHRAYINNTQEGFNPEIFVSKDEYKEVFMNDDFFVTSFFMADQDKPFPGQELFESDISIIFQVKLSKLLPGITHRADEEFNNEVSVVLDGLSGDITFNGITQGIPDVYAEFDQSKIPWSDIQPFYVVRFDLTATYFFDCSRTFAGTICTIAVTVSGTDPTTSGGSDGTATANDTGGQGNITYLWDDPSAQTTKTATGLLAGTFTVIVTDDIKDSCTATGNTTLEDPVAPPALILSLNPSDATTINTPNPPLPSVSDPVSFFKDLSTFGNNHTQGTGALQPLWETDKLAYTSTKRLVSSSTDFNFGTSDSFTVQIWFFPTSLSANGSLIGKWSASAGDRSYLVLLESTGNVRFFIRTTLGVNASTGGTTVTVINNWYFAVIIWDAVTELMKVSVTIEGLALADVPNSGSNADGINPTTADFFTGDSGQGGLTGKEGKIKVYNEARSQSQFNTDYLIGH